MPSARFGAVFALTTLAAAPPPTLAAAQTESRSLRGTEVAVYNLAGRLRVLPGTGDAVVVEIHRGGADRERLRIETGTVRGRETMRVVYPSDRIVYRDARARSRVTMRVRGDGTFSDGAWNDFSGQDRVEIRDSGQGLDAFADLVVRVPRGQRIALYLGVGRAEVANVEGDVLVDVAGAEVDVTGTKGNLTLDTGSGRVMVRDVTGDVNIDAGSGGVSLDRIRGSVLRIDSGSGGVEGSDVEVREFRADVGSGGLRVYRMKAAVVDAETGSGGVQLDLLSNPERMDIETGSGGATIRVPATLGAEIEAETGSGGFSTDFEITTRRVSRNHIIGRIGDGKSRVRIEAGSGSVRLLKN